MERICSRTAVVFAFTNQNTLRIPPLIAGLCVLSVVRKGLYHKARSGQLKLAEAEAFFRFDEWSPSSRSAGEFSKRWWTWCLADEVTGPEWDRFGNELSLRYDIDDRKDLLPLLANQVVDRLRVA